MTTLSRLLKKIKTCRNCGLSELRTNAVPGEGSGLSGIMLVGEAPGNNEDLAGRPFVGAAGKLLEKFLAQVPIVREEVYITNLVKCRPPENRNPKPAEIQACRPFLEAQLHLFNPRVVITLGNFPMQALLEEKHTISKVHGEIFRKDGVLYFPSYHPAAALYARRLESVITDDFLKLRKILREDA